MQTQTKQKNCAELISARYVDREKQFSDAWNDDSIFWPQYLSENTLAFDFVEPDTFDNQPIGYYRLQFSWGGPSDEVRWYSREPNTYYKITYSYMDWFDGAEINVSFDNIWQNIFDQYYETVAPYEGLE
jgi:hypothetical protein